MATNGVNSWDEIGLAASEATWGQTQLPVTADALEIISLSLGPSAEVGKTRAKKDRPQGRGMQTGFVEGDVEPFPFTAKYSQKSRALVDSPAKDLVLMKAAGLTQTITASTNTVLVPGATPIASGTFNSAQLVRYFGKVDSLHEAEYLNGCVVESLEWSGGDTEVMVTASGKGVVKTHLGAVDSATFASAVTTSITPTASEVRRFGAANPNPSGTFNNVFMQIEAEVIDIRAPDYITPAFSPINRALAGTTGAAHTAKRMFPYMPILSAFTGSPISEANCTAILGTISPILLMSWNIKLTTGMALRPHETSSKYVQGPKSLRTDWSVKAKMFLSGNRVDLLGYIRNRDTLSLTITQGSGVGGIISFTFPTVEVMPFTIPDTENDSAIVDVEFRVRENGTGNNSCTITLT